MAAKLYNPTITDNSQSLQTLLLNWVSNDFAGTPRYPILDGFNWTVSIYRPAPKAVCYLSSVYYVLFPAWVNFKQKINGEEVVVPMRVRGQVWDNW